MIYVHNIKTKTKTALIFTFVFALTTLLEHFLLDAFFKTGDCDHYFSTTFAAFFIFMLTVQHNSGCDKKYNRILSFIGGELSTNIYIIHMIVIQIFDVILDFCSKTILWPFVHIYWRIAPLLVFVCTLLVTWVLFRITAAVKSKVRCSK